MKNKPVKHLRIREQNELGGTRFFAICGASGITARYYPKSAAQVDCQNCIFILSPAWKKREAAAAQQKGK